MFEISDLPCTASVRLLCFDQIYQNKEKSSDSGVGRATFALVSLIEARAADFAALVTVLVRNSTSSHSEAFVRLFAGGPSHFVPVEVERGSPGPAGESILP